MTVPMIMSWCAGNPCDPCAPKPPPPQPPSGGFALPPFTEAAINIRQYQVYVSASGQENLSLIGQMTIYSAIDNIPPAGAFGTPSILGPPEYGSISTFVLYESWIQILHPYYPPSAYFDGTISINGGEISGSQISSTSAIYGMNADQTAAYNNSVIAAGNQAITQANQILGNP